MVRRGSIRSTKQKSKHVSCVTGATSGVYGFRFGPDGVIERLDNPRDKREEYLSTALADRGLVNLTDHLLIRRRYRGVGGWTWIMQRDEQQVKVRGDYFLSTYRISFVYTRLQETLHGTDHRLILVVLRGEGALHKCRYQRGRTIWPIRPN